MSKPRPATSSICKGSCYHPSNLCKLISRRRNCSQSELNRTLNLMKSYKIVRDIPIAFELHGETKILQHPYENLNKENPNFEGNNQQALNSNLKQESSNLEINSLIPTDNDQAHSSTSNLIEIARMMTSGEYQNSEKPVLERKLTEDYKIPKENSIKLMAEENQKFERDQSNTKEKDISRGIADLPIRK